MQEHCQQRRATSTYPVHRVRVSARLKNCSYDRVLQTQNQALQQAVKSMSTRIRELELALNNTQAQISPQPHPLLSESSKLPEVDAIASLISDDGEASLEDVEEETAELIGAMSIGEQGQTKFHGVSSSSEVFIALSSSPLVMVDSSHNSTCRLCSR